jgi:hypothetical protein
MNRDEDPVQSYERAVAAFEGAAKGSAELADRKMFTIVASDGGADTRIAKGEFTVLWPYRREPFRYFSCLSPSVVATLRQHAPGGSFSRPFALDGATLSRLGFLKNRASWFWVSRTSDAITIASRPASGSANPPLMPEALAPWRPAEKIFAKFEPPRHCPYCTAQSARYRLVDDVLICLACGRSQRIQKEDLHDAVLERAG